MPSPGATSWTERTSVPSSRRVSDHPRPQDQSRVEGPHPGGDGVQVPLGVADLVAAGHRQPCRGPVEPARGPPLRGRTGLPKPVGDRGHSATGPCRGGPSGVDEALGGPIEAAVGPPRRGPRLLASIVGVLPVRSRPLARARRLHAIDPGAVVSSCSSQLSTSCTTARAAAVGVEQAVWATSSATLTVGLVAYAGEDGTLARRDGPGHQLVVEGDQVGAAAAPSRQHHHIHTGAGHRRSRPRSRRERRGPAPVCRSSNTWKAKPLAANTFNMSAWAALPTEVTRPTRSGTGARARPALRLSAPFRLERRQQRLAFRRERPQRVGRDRWRSCATGAVPAARRSRASPGCARSPRRPCVWRRRAA